MGGSSSRWGTALHPDRDILGPATMPVWQDDDGGNKLPLWGLGLILVGFGILAFLLAPFGEEPEEKAVPCDLCIG